MNGGSSPAGLVGREREVGELAAAIDSVERGRGRLYLLEGEPGIGKTSLAEASSELARARGFAVAWGRCWEDGGAPAYWPWTQVLRVIVRGSVVTDETALERAGSIVRGIGAPDPPPLGGADELPAQFALFDAVTTILRGAAERQPSMLILDDLHAADQDSLRMLRFVARELPHSPILIVGTYRADDAVRRGTASLLARLARDGRELPLRGLSRSQVGAVVEHIAGEAAPDDVVEAIHVATQGNPLFVDAITQVFVAEHRLQAPGITAHRPGEAASLPMPPSIREAIRLRLDHVDDDTRTLLRVAAVIGRSFTVTVLSDVVGQPADSLLIALGDAVRSGILRPVPRPAGTYTFDHIVVRDVLVGELDPGSRGQLHCRVGAALERVHAEDLESHLAELAHHFLLGIGAEGSVLRAVDYAERAGRLAMRQAAYEEAAALFGRALEALSSSSDSDPARRCDLLLAIGAARTRGGDLAAGRSTYLEVAALARNHRLTEKLATAAIGYAGLTGYHFSGRRDETLIGLLSEALASLPRGDSTTRVRLLARLAVALYWSESDGRASELSEEAVATARRLKDPATLAMAVHSRRYAQWGPDSLEQRLADGALCQELAIEANETELAASALRWRFTDLLEDGDVGAAAGVLDKHNRFADELQQPFLLALTAQFRATQAILQGRFGDGQVAALDARELAERAGNSRAGAVHGMQMLPVWWQRHDVEHLAEFERTLRRDAPPHRLTTCATAFVHAELGEAATAAALLAQAAGSALRKLRHDMEYLPTLVFVSLAEDSLGIADRAETLYDLLRPYAGRVVIVGAPVQACWGAVDHHLGVLARSCGRDHWAREHFESALQIGGRLGSLPLLAETRLQYGLMLLSDGNVAERSRAATMLDDVRATASALGMARIVDRVDQLAGSAAGTPPAALAPSPAVECRLQRIGDYWTVTTPRGIAHLRDSKGMQYLDALLSRPGQRIHVLELVGAAGAATGHAPVAGASDAGEAGVAFSVGFGDAGELLDDAAKAAYRRRLGELDELIAEAEQFNDIERATQLGVERDLLVDQLTEAVGLGGRDRRAASATERARVNVTRAIRSAIRRIGEGDARAGRHLDDCVITGTYCSYEPVNGRAESFR